MGSVNKRDDGRYLVRYRDADKKEHVKTFDKKKDADAWLDNVTASLVRGDYIDPTAGRVALKVYAEAWRVAQVHRPTTAAQVETNLRRHVYPTLGDKELGRIRPSEVQAFVKRLTETLAPGTVEVVFRYVSAIFAAAVEDGLIRANPCRG
jgi:hypothetical protein